MSVQDGNSNVGADESTNGAIPYLGVNLTELLRSHLSEIGSRDMGDLTVMASHRDCFRQEKYRAQAEWFAARVAKVPHLPIHVRGLHYAAIGDTKPNGTPYANTERDYSWMQDQPAKAGRWLGQVPFTAIVDQKNDAPRIVPFERPDPARVIRIGDVEIMLPSNLEPRAALEGFYGAQPFKLVLVAEKSAVGPVLLPIAQRYGADCFFAGGEISDTHLYDIAARGARDGRETVVLTFTDADPAGYWMPCVVGRKLQALKENWFPDLSFRVQPVGLLPEQVEAINADDPPNPLPSSPLKEGEKRAGAWERHFGIQQVELDAIATLRPDVLREIAINGISPFYDAGLDYRVYGARQAWEQEAQRALEEQLGDELLDQIRAGVQGKVAALENLARQINDELWVPTDGVELPPMPAIPDPILSNGVPPPLASSAMGFVELTRALKARGAYSKAGEDKMHGKPSRRRTADRHREVAEGDAIRRHKVLDRYLEEALARDVTRLEVVGDDVAPCFTDDPATTALPDDGRLEPEDEYLR